MSIYDIHGDSANGYSVDGELLDAVYNMQGEEISDTDAIEEKTGIAYPFTAMTMTDSSGIATMSSEHLRNASSSIKLTNSAQSTAQTVSFTTNINTGGERTGIWLYTTRRDIGVYGSTASNSYYIKAKVTVNNVQKTLALRAGMNYYVWLNSEVGNTITSISVEITSTSQAGGSVYLDSVEVGYYMTKKPIVMFNFDMSPNNFVNDSGFNLFQQYGMKATVQYVLTEDATVGSGAVAFNSTNHQTVVGAGHDYGTYSGWQYWDLNKNPIPNYDDDSHRADFDHHADLMFHINNDNDVYAPSIVHSTGFKCGETYDRALIDGGFPLIRVEYNQTNDACFASVDWDYGEIIPFFWWGEQDSGSELGLKARIAITYAVRNRMCLQIGSHTIQDELTNSMNIGTEAMRELLAFCKTKVDNGELIVCTTAEFLRRTMPREKYVAWLTERQKSFVY